MEKGEFHLRPDPCNNAHIHEGGPALLLLGNAFIDNEPWPQIRDRLDRPPTEQFKHFLGSLDAAAQAGGMRAIVCIDALNERNGIDVWPHRLTPFLKTFEAFPRVGLILSCRSSYVPHVIPAELSEDHLFRVDHSGFAANGGEAAKVYLDKRGIVRPGAPNLVPEFENPLFLKTCCDALKKEGKTELPKGLRGVSSIFRFYIEAVSEALNRRMKLDPHLEIVPKAIARFARLLVEAGKGYAARGDAGSRFESVLASGGSIEKSLLSQLESEGILTVEPVRQDDGSETEMARFTFERFSDHAIATHLLDEHLNDGDVSSSFQIGQPLGDFVFGPKNYERAGIVEALAIQLPERTGVEIVDVGAKASHLVRHALLSSLLWREQPHFTNRTFELARDLLQTEELNDLLVSISTEPSNKFNAFFVHTRLMKMTLSARDALWSVPLAKRGFDGAVETLISWAMRSDLEHIDEDRAYLAATMLTWFLTTSHREVRDKATKALASLLSTKLLLAPRLLSDFGSVNDPYVLERLLAACYGAALQGAEEAELAELAQAVFDTVFANGRPAVNALLRDHAQGIVEYAVWRGVLSGSIDLTLARPPYQSPWPIEPVPDKLIESYTEDRGHGAIHDAIVGSTANYADFARYVVDHKVDKWNPATLGTTPLPTSRDIYKSWLKDFSANATSEQLQALNAYVAATDSAGDVHRHPPTPETKRLGVTELALQHIMESDQWEDFRIRAKDFIQRQPFAGSGEDRPARFNADWCCRWICKRAHELGWTSELFGEFDEHYPNHDPNDHRVERIGKKYQWLALHELIARMADNLAYIDNRWEGGDADPTGYSGVRTVELRDIDPSLLTTQTHYDGWGEWGKTWWVPFDPAFRPMGPLERRAWLAGESDIINDSALINLRNPKTGRRWLALSGFSKWTGHGVRDGSKEMQRDTWFRLSCFVVRRKHQAKIVESLKDTILTDPASLSDIDLYSDYFYLGEYPWLVQKSEFDEWSSDHRGMNLAAPIRPAVVRYVCSRSGYDYSIDRTVRVKIPAPWLAEEMGLRLSTGRSLIFVDSDGRDTFYDRSVVESGPSTALVDCDDFLKTLSQKDLSAIWVIAGEKNAYGGRKIGDGFGGCFRHSAVYHLGGDGFVQQLHTDWLHPSKKQLEKFFGEEPIPPGIETKA